ncbi:hypothetical protein OROHE_009671 [Orobanche hederae]
MVGSAPSVNESRGDSPLLYVSEAMEEWAKEEEYLLETLHGFFECSVEVLASIGNDSGLKSNQALRMATFQMLNALVAANGDKLSSAAYGVTKAMPISDSKHFPPRWPYSEQIEESLGESKLAAEERATAIKNAEEGAFDLKKSFEELSKSLDEHETEYQVLVSSRDEDKCLEDQLRDAKICCWKGRDITEEIANKSRPL